MFYFPPNKVCVSFRGNSILSIFLVRLICMSRLCIFFKRNLNIKQHKDFIVYINCLRAIITKKINF